MTLQPVCVDAVEVWELGELLEFVADWLRCGGDGLGSSLREFVGGDGYGLEGLRTDLERFSLLLTGSGGVGGQW